jgi:hypothetical protein
MPGAPEEHGDQPSGLPSLGRRLGAEPGDEDPAAGPQTATTRQPGRRGIWGVDHTTDAPSGLRGAVPAGEPATPAGQRPDETTPNAPPRWNDDDQPEDEQQ